MIFLKVFGWCVVFFIFFVSAVSGLILSEEAKTSHREWWLILGGLGLCGMFAWIVQGVHWTS